MYADVFEWFMVCWQEGSSNDQLFDRLEQALKEAESSNQKAFEESDRRVKAEMNATRAMRQVMSSAFQALFSPLL